MSPYKILMESTVVSKKGTITIPAAIRKELNITAGMKFDIVIENGAILLIPFANLDDKKWEKGTIEESLRDLEETHKQDLINEQRL